MNRSGRNPIVILTYSLAGGAGRVLVHLATGLASSGEGVEVATMRSDDKLRDELSQRGVPVYSLRDKGLRRSLPVIVRLLKERRHSIVISSGYGMNVTVMIGRMLAGHHGKVILREDLHLGATWRLTRGRFARHLLQRIVGRTYRRADCVVGVSQAASKYLTELIGDNGPKVVTIYNPVVDDRLEMLAKQAIEHEWIADRDQVPIILGVGRIVEQKDFLTLVRAFRYVRERRRARLIIVGDGPLRSQVEAEVQACSLEEDVELVGWDSNPVRWMANASLFVLSSRWEGFGLVLVEAMAVGTPVVSTDCESGPAEILQDGKFGVLVEPGNAVQMGQAIIDSLSMSPDRAALLERSRAFTAIKAITKYRHIVEQLKAH